MKKIISLFFVLLFGVMLSGCLPNDNDDKVDKPDTLDGEMAKEVSDDDSLMMIEEELDDTDLVEFEAELDALDEEINQL
jgi:hypothetical protein